MGYVFALHSRQEESHKTAGTPVRSNSADARLIAALRGNDETVLGQLLERYQRTMLRVALSYVSSLAVAEEVVQETWISFLQSLERFEGRCALKTWLFRILVNRAKVRALHERRSLPFSALRRLDGDDEDAAIDPTQFDPASGQWTTVPRSWETIPEERLLAQETRAHIHQAIAALPANQRIVISLRDIVGWSSEEVCSYLGISETNQRVLLHRARSKVRRALEHYLGDAGGCG